MVEDEKKKSWKAWAIAGGVIVIITLVVLVFNGTFSKKEEIPPDYPPIENISTSTPEEISPVPVAAQPVLSSKDCGDGICGLQETYANCPVDCINTCGNGKVDDAENWKNCRQELLMNCGDSICQSWEHYRYCPQDCAECIVDDSGKYEGPNECPPSPRWVI